MLSVYERAGSSYAAGNTNYENLPRSEDSKKSQRSVQFSVMLAESLYSQGLRQPPPKHELLLESPGSFQTLPTGLWKMCPPARLKVDLQKWSLNQWPLRGVHHCCYPTCSRPAGACL